MSDETTLEMNSEEFLRSRLNARSEKLPKNLNEAVKDQNLLLKQKCL